MNAPEHAMKTAHEHLTDDDLVLHYYGEMTAPEEEAAAGHLEHCPSCRTAFARLQRVLGAVDETTLAPVEVPDGFERTVWARLEPALRAERRGTFPWLMLSPAPLALAATVAMLVGAAFFAGRSLPHSVPAPAAPPGLAAERVRERILLIDLGEHLDRSQAVLVELVSADPDGSIDISVERERAEQLVAANRLYRVTAAATGNTAVSALLDDLERVLVDVAAAPATATPQDLDALRHRIDARSLLFRVRAASSDVRDRQKDAQERAHQRL
jgi:anti-sigma factor RsiW